MKKKGFKNQQPLNINRDPCILLAEDDDEMRLVLMIYLKKFGYEIIDCKNGKELIEKLDEYFIQKKKDKKIDLIISDIKMPYLSGFEVLRGIYNFKGFPPMILITAFGNEELHKAAKKLGALAVFDKPFDLDELLLFIENIFLKNNGEKLF